MLKPEVPYVIVSVVTPQTDRPETSGRIINFPCSPTVSHEMLEQVGDKMEWSLRGPWRDRGYTTMDALYRQENNEAGLEAWVKFIQRGQAGQVQRGEVFDRSKLPREVIRRQACGEVDEAKALSDANRTAPVTNRTRKDSGA